MVAYLPKETVEGFFPSSCQYVSFAKVTTQVRFVEPQMVRARLHLPLGLQEVVNDLKPGLLGGFAWHCLGAGAVEAIFDLLEHGFGVATLFALAALDARPESHPLMAVGIWLSQELLGKCLLLVEERHFVLVLQHLLLVEEMSLVFEKKLHSSGCNVHDVSGVLVDVGLEIMISSGLAMSAA